MALLAATTSQAHAQGSDDCTAPPILTNYGTYAFDTTVATSSGFTGATACPSAVLPTNQDLFWVFIPPFPGQYTFDTFGSGFDTEMAIHDGSDCSATCIASNDDSGSLQSQVSIANAQAGAPILIQVGGWGNSSGVGQLNISGPDVAVTAREHMNLHLMLEAPMLDLQMALLEPGMPATAQAQLSWAGSYSDAGWQILVSGTIQGTQVVLNYSGTLDTVDPAQWTASYVGNGNIQSGWDSVGIAVYTVGPGEVVHDFAIDVTASGTGLLPRWLISTIEVVGGGLAGGLATGGAGVISGAGLGLAFSKEASLYSSASAPVRPPLPPLPPNVPAQSVAPDDVVTNVFGSGQLEASVGSIFTASGQFANGSASGTFDVHLMPGDVGTNYCQSFPNSSGTAALIAATGSSTVADNDLTLVAINVPPAQFGAFITSTTQASVPVGNGFLCVGPPLDRFFGPGQILNSGSSGQVSLPIDLMNFPSGSSSVQVAPGETRNFQYWYRDTAGTGSGFSNGLEVQFN